MSFAAFLTPLSLTSLRKYHPETTPTQSASRQVAAIARGCVAADATTSSLKQITHPANAAGGTMDKTQGSATEAAFFALSNAPTYTASLTAACPPAQGASLDIAAWSRAEIIRADLRPSVASR